MFSSEDTTAALNQTANTQPALFAVEYALAQLWLSWGIRPAVVMGHSVGEYAAACMAGVFSLEDGLKLIAERGRLMQALPAGGGMVSVMADEATVNQAIADFSEVVIAAINGPQSIVISGPQTDLDKVVCKLDPIKTKALAVSHAFHSAQMEPILADFRKVAEQIQYQPPRLNLISNVTGEVMGAEIATANYWCRHVRMPVQFYKGMQCLAGLKPDVYLELGPKPILLGMGRQCGVGDQSLWLPSLRPPRADWQSLLSSLGQLYVNGAAIDWQAVDADYAQQRVVLPGYPFQRQRYWVEVSSRVTTPGLALNPSTHPLLGQRLALAGLKDVRFTTQLSIAHQPYLQDHQIYQQVIVPATAYLEMALAAGQQALKQQAVQLQSVSIQQPLMLLGTQPQTVQVVLSPEADLEKTFRFEIFSLSEPQDEDPVWTCHAAGQVGAADSPLDVSAVDLSQLEQQYGEPVSTDAFYQQLTSQGMAYGPSFQGVQQLRPAETSVLGEVSLPDEIDTNGYCLHPALLDACFQVLGALMPSGEDAAYLPVAIEQLSVTGSVQGKLWSQVELQSDEQTAKKSKRRNIVVNISLFDAAGEPVAKLQGLSLKRVPKRVLQRVLQQDTEENWLYRIDWQPVGAPTAEPPNATDHWLVFAEDSDRSLLEQLATAGVGYTQVTIGSRFKQVSESVFELDPTQPEQYGQLLDAIPSVHGILHQWGSTPVEVSALSAADLQQAQQRSCGSVLHLLQALTAKNLSLPGGLWLMTRGAHAVGPHATTLQPQQASVWGLGRVIAIEHPELNCHCLDLDPDSAVAPTLLDDLCGGAPDNQIAYRNGQRFAARLVRFKDPQLSEQSNPSKVFPDAPFQVRISEYGVMENLQRVPMTRKSPGPGEVEIQVRSVGLNFRDVLNALGMLKAFTEEMGITDTKDLPFGGECAGIVAAVGEGVSDLRVGDAVIAAQTIGSLSSFVNVPADFVVPKPASLSFDEAATIPTAFLTAYYALHERAQLKAGEKVLIHSASGGVGQAAVQIAQWLGADIWGTASQPKWEALREMGVSHVFNSRSVEFAQQVLDATDGEGVDVVLNSLNGEFIPHSLKSLAQQGRFVEIGKLGIWSPEQMAEERSDVHYEPFDLLDISLQNTGAIRQLLEALIPRFEAGELKPLKHVSFPIEEMADAFRFMAQAKHIGKVVISLPDLAEAGGTVSTDVASTETTSADHRVHTPFVVRGEGTYLVTGGLGALGLQVAQWLIDRGAKHLALMGRSEPSQQANEVLQSLERKGASVQVLRADVADADALARALDQLSAPLKGVFHTAGLLDDAMLLGQSWQQFERVMQPKVQGTWLLHQLSADQNLDCFVCFSSVSALVGSPGQANYAAANAFMDAFAHYRQSLGLRGLSINWGPWANSGMAAALHSRNQARWAAQGVSLIEPNQGLGLMGQLLEQPGSAQAAVLPVDWRLYLAQMPPGLNTSLLKRFQSQLPTATQTPTLLLELQQAPAHKRLSLLSRQLQSLIAKVLGLPSPESVQPRHRLFDLGIDSLMAVELKSRLEAGLDCQLRSTLIFDYPTLEALVGYLVAEVLSLDTGEPAPEPEPPAKDSPEDAMAADVADLSESEAEALLLAELSKVTRSMAN
ncbi:MAG: SDR family oxidoreductase [Cyanobacteria bacterium P01_G01_bin.38]